MEKWVRKNCRISSKTEQNIKNLTTLLSVLLDGVWLLVWNLLQQTLATCATFSVRLMVVHRHSPVFIRMGLRDDAHSINCVLNFETLLYTSIPSMYKWSSERASGEYECEVRATPHTVHGTSSSLCLFCFFVCFCYVPANSLFFLYFSLSTVATYAEKTHPKQKHTRMNAK